MFKLLYILLFLAVIIDIDKKSRMGLLSYIFLFLFISVAGFRYLGVDYGCYEYLFNNVTNKCEYGILKTTLADGYSIETGFVLFAYFSKSFVKNFQFFIFIYAFISILIKFIAFKIASPSVLYSILIFSSYYFYKDLGQIRNAMSSGMLLLSLVMLANKKRLFSLLCNFFAILNHSMGICGIPFLFYRKIANPKFLIIILLSCILIQPLVYHLSGYLALFSLYFGVEEDRIGKRIVHVMEDSSLSVPFYMMNTFYIFFIFSLLFIYAYKNMKENSKYSEMLITVFICGFSASISIQGYGIFASRLRELLCYPTLCVLLPIFMNCYRGYKKGFIQITLILYSFYNILANYSTFSNYQSLLQFVF